MLHAPCRTASGGRSRRRRGPCRGRARDRGALASFSAARSRTIASATASSAAFFAAVEHAPSRATRCARGGRDRSCTGRCSSWVSTVLSPLGKGAVFARAPQRGASVREPNAPQTGRRIGDSKPMRVSATRSARRRRAAWRPAARMRDGHGEFEHAVPRIRRRFAPLLSGAARQPFHLPVELRRERQRLFQRAFRHARERRADQPLARPPDAIFAQQRGERLARRDAALRCAAACAFPRRAPRAPARPLRPRPSGRRACAPGAPTSPVSIASFSLNTS